MTDSFAHMQEDDLRRVIRDAERALGDIRRSRRKGVEAQIRKLAESIGMDVQLKPASTTSLAGASRASASRGSKVAPKYRHPAQPSLTWTGRGVSPNWLKALESQGRRREEFLIRS